MTTPPETAERRCPHCHGYSIGSFDSITAEAGLIKTAYRRASCGGPFTFVRHARGIAGLAD